MSSSGRAGVVLLQMGGPRSPDELPGFLRALFTDPDMIQLPDWVSPFQGLLGSAYGTMRARKVRPDYEAIGWSDIVPTTRSLADAIEDRLDDVVGVRTAMRYTEPRAEAAVRELVDAGADRLVALTLYPFYSQATTGSSLNDLERVRDRVAPDLGIDAIERWGDADGFLDLQAAWTRETLEQAYGGDRAILLSAHGLPEVYVEDGDPYRDEVERAARSLSKRLPDERVELAFQSDVGPVEWMHPYTDEAIEALAADGVDELVVVPFGFVSEHIETLFEIDVEYREEAHEAGIDEVHRVPAFDDDPAFADLLADLVRRREAGA